MSLKRSIRDMLIMTKAERNGVLVLLVLIVVVIVVRLILPGYLSNDDAYLEEIEQKIAFLELEKEQVTAKPVEEISKPTKTPTVKKSFNKSETVAIPEKLFDFDPNIVSFDELIKLGFSQRVAHTLIKYREKGGSFRKKTDLIKIYGLDSTLFWRIEKYIVLKTDTTNETQTIVAETKTEYKPKITLEVNSADSADWTLLYGIGPVFARRICNFRKYLGGFVSIGQLQEVYHLSPETYSGIKDQLIIDTSIVSKININFADINDLKKHPYCNYNLAKKIVNYRAKYGSINHVNQLIQDSVLTINEYERFAPYLTVK